MNKRSIFFVVASMMMWMISAINTYAGRLGWVTTAPSTAQVGSIITIKAQFIYGLTSADAKTENAYAFVIAGNYDGDYVSGMPSVSRLSESNGTLTIRIDSRGNGVFYVIAMAEHASYSDRIQINVTTPPELTLSSPVSEAKPGTQITLTYTTKGGSGSPSWSILSPVGDTVSNGVVQLSNENIARTVTVTLSFSGLTKSVTLSVKAICDAPVITPGDGTVFPPPNQKVVLSCATAGSVIYYTLDGSTPTSNSFVYSAAFNITNDTTIKTFASAAGFYDSPITTATLTKYRETLSAPTITAKRVETDGLIEPHQEVTIVSDNGASVFYTLDGSTPSESSTLYKSPFYVFTAASIKAIAIRDGWHDSTVSSLVVTNSLSFGDAVNCTNLTMESPTWTIDEKQAFMGMLSMNSGPCADGATNAISCETEGFQTISFRWKCSCEDDPEYDNWDYLCFLVNGEEKARIDGNTDWQEVTMDLLTPDVCLLSWEYRKDSQLSAGEDCGWLDGLSITELCVTNSGIAVPFEWLHKYFGKNLVSRSDYEEKWESKGENGLLVWQSFVAGLDPTDQNSGFIVTISIDGSGKPVVEWNPKLSNEEAAKREYSILGATSLEGSADWQDVTDIPDLRTTSYRFFKAKVELK